MLPPRATQEDIRRLQEKYGLDKPIYIQYFIWIKQMFQGNFGTSISVSTGQNVSVLIMNRLPYTLALTITALCISLIIGIPTGVISAKRPHSRTDYATTLLSFFWLSMPSFWLGLLFMLFFGLHLRILPISGASGVKSLILPAFTLGLPQIGSVTRLMRSEMLEVKREEFIKACIAKGLKERTILYVHLLRNAIIPVVVLQFLYLPWLIGGSVVVETVFAWPGMGRLLFQAIIAQDYPIVQAVILIIAILTAVSNFLGDIISALLDPRIRIRES